ncbi:MAG: glycosyltransferase [Sphingobacteriaceae bacterium]|nr:MAG: glycosyltransferase [Sphingobacteriaceae bacterium]
MSLTFSKDIDSKFLLPFNEDLGIPRIIHQTFMSKNLPAELQENVDNIKNLNPDWIHILYDDDDIQHFIKENYGSVMLSYFERINPRYGAARADLFRYLLMYKCGGVYLDIKSTCTCSLDQVLKPDDKYILSQWRNKPGEMYAGFGISKEVTLIDGGEYQQWHIVSAPGHPFLKKVIDTVLRNMDLYRPWLHGTGGIGVLRLTGPLVYTLAIHPLLATAPYRLVKDETVIGLKYSVYTNTHHRSVYKTNYSLLTESILEMKTLDKLLAYLYSFAKKSKHLVFGR